MENTVYSVFASRYFGRFMESLVLGCSGGLYEEEILVKEGEEGTFEKDDIIKFIKFRHGDNDYHYKFGNRDDNELRNNPVKLAEEFLSRIDDDSVWYAKDHYTEVAPNLIKNTKRSLQKIIGG